MLYYIIEIYIFYTKNNKFYIKNANDGDDKDGRKKR